jgi:phosphate acyltransferase
MRIAVDAMGGDNAPEAIVAGALLAAPQCSEELVLVGPDERLRQVLDGKGAHPRLAIHHAPDVVGMGEPGPVAIREKRETSLSVAMRLLAAGDVDAVVNAGNSSAVVATARHYVGLIRGLRRPALAVWLPTPADSVFLIDVGAHAEAVPDHLAQSAALAHAYLKVVGGIGNPRLALLNIGKEPGKGSRSTQRAYALLERSSLNFVGNLEPRELFTGHTDVVVCDGFIGNIVLKLHEGWAANWCQFMENSPPLDGLSAAMKTSLRQYCRHLESRFDYQDVGGTPLLGVRGTVVVAHGCSRAPAIANAIHVAVRALECQSVARVVEYLETTPILSELKHYSARWVLDHWKSRWGGRKKHS